MPASLLDPAATPAAARRRAAPAGRAAVAARGALGGGWRPCCSRPGWPRTSAAGPGVAGVGAVPGLLRGRRLGAGPGRAAGAAGADPGRRPADGRRRGRRRGDRAGPRRRPADRHLRHLRRPGGGRDPPHRAGGARPARPGPRAGHPARRRRQPRRSSTRRACGSGTWCWCGPASGSAPTARCWTGPARSTRPRSPASRCPSPRQPGDEVFAGTLQRHRRAAGAGQPGRLATPWSPGSSPWSSEASATKARTQLFIEKVEQRYSARHGRRDPAAVRGPAARRRGVPARRCCAR